MKQLSILYLLIFFFCLKKINNDLYVSSVLKYAFYEDFKKDASAGYIAIGNMEGLYLKIIEGIGILTTKEIWHGWHGASLGQIPPTSTANSYFSFSDIETIEFKIKSSDISASEIKVFLQPKMEVISLNVP